MTASGKMAGDQEEERGMQITITPPMVDGNMAACVAMKGNQSGTTPTIGESNMSACITMSVLHETVKANLHITTTPHTKWGNAAAYITMSDTLHDATATPTRGVDVAACILKSGTPCRIRG